MKIKLPKLSKKQWFLISLIGIFVIIILWSLLGNKKPVAPMPDNKQASPDGWEYCSNLHVYVLVGESCPLTKPGKKNPEHYIGEPRYYLNGQYYNTMPTA